MDINDLSLLILSCQNYSDLWSNNLLLLKKNWPNHPKTILVSDGPGVYDLASPEQLLIVNGDMTDRIIKSLEQIDTKYIVFSLDDYYFERKVNEKEIKAILEYMVENNVDYCGFNRNKHGRVIKIKNTRMSKLMLNHTYDINLFLSIWRKDSFLKCLRRGEDIWKAEVMLTKRFKENDFNACCITKNNIIPFIDIVQKGKYIRKNYKFLKKNGLYISNRNVQSTSDVFKLRTKYFLSKCTPIFIRNKLKNVYRKKGGMIYSDYAENNEEKN